MTGKNNLPGNDPERLHEEIGKWRRLLNSMTEENVSLKNELAGILKNKYDKDSLEDMENFQTRFIKEDELINLLKTDVDQLYNLLHGRMSKEDKKISRESKIEKSFNTRMKKVRKDIDGSAVRFSVLRSNFKDFQHKLYSK